MQPDLRARADRRNDATRRRTELTAATAVIGLLATAGFGRLAAETSAGPPATDTTTSTTTESATNPTATQPTATATPSTDSSTSNGSTSGSSGSSSSGSSSSGVSRSSGRAHVTTGSS